MQGRQKETWASGRLLPVSVRLKVIVESGDTSERLRAHEMPSFRRPIGTSKLVQKGHINR